MPTSERLTTEEIATSTPAVATSEGLATEERMTTEEAVTNLGDKTTNAPTSLVETVENTITIDDLSSISMSLITSSSDWVTMETIDGSGVVSAMEVID